MSQSICDCHCGTRIDLDEQLLEQRQMWKQKYLCLQKQVKIDIETLKQNIYAECAGIMQQQFSAKQLENNRVINQKNIEIKDLIARVINLETQIKILTKEKQIVQQTVRDLQIEINQKNDIINSLKTKSSKGIRDWQLKHEQQITNLKQRLVAQAKQNIDKIEADRQVLKQKLKQFEVKYSKIIPEIQKMKNCLNAKTAQNEELINTVEKLKKKAEEDQKHYTTKYDDLTRIHGTCTKQIKDLSDTNENLYRQLDKCKKLTRQVKVEPVYIDRPVEVEKVVEKVVQVQKLVNKYVDNPNNEKRVKNLEDENSRLKEQLNHVLMQIRQMEDHYKSSIEQFQQNIKQHEKNVGLYKKERQALAAKIGQQNKELEMLHHFIEKLSSEKASKGQGDNEKIVVHVKQDGTYQKTVQKLPAPTNPTNQRRKK